MPTRSRFDPAAVRQAVEAAWINVVALVESVPDEDFSKPTRLGDWTVAELVAHLSRNPTFLHEGLAASSADAIAGPSRLESGDYYRHTRPDPRIADRSKRDAAGQTPDQLRAVTRERAEEALELLRRTSDDAVVTFGSGAGETVAAYLPSRCVEASVHSLDLAAATGIDPRLDRDARDIAARLLAVNLAARAPGRSVELRIPPAAAVQCIEGPRHTRGTPPNVVEMDPVTWLEVSTGRVTWAEASGQGRIAASGERADLSAYLPVMS